MRESIFSSRMKLSLLVVFCVIVSVSSRNVKEFEEKLEQLSANQTQTVLSDLKVAGEVMKRVGEITSRALWVKRRKLVFPTGTVLTLAPKITVPAFRRKPFKGGLNSDIQATMFFYVYLDKMGMTDDMHPFPFDMPPFYPFGPLMRPIEGKDGGKKDKEKEKEKEQKPGHPMGSMGHPPMHMQYPDYPTKFEAESSYKSDKGTTVYSYFPIGKRAGSEQSETRSQTSTKSSVRRKPRSIMDLPPPERLPGGERASLLPKVENMLGTFGFEGRGCMLRAICEIHEYPMQEGYGLLGEMIALFFSVSASPYAETHMPEYLKAEDAGRTGDCSAYTKLCAKSIFKTEVEKKKYEDIENNEVPVSLRSKYADYDEL